MGTKAEKTVNRMILGALILGTLACMVALIVAFCFHRSPPSVPLPHT